jgi:hypothetical protein
MSVTTFQTLSRHYLCAEGGGGSTVVANRTEAGPWEQWTVEKRDGGLFAFKSHNGCYLGVEGTRVTCDRTSVGEWEEWEVEQAEAAPTRYVIRNNYTRLFLCAEGGGGGTVVCDRPLIGPWEQWEPSADFLGPGHPVVADPIRGQLQVLGHSYAHGDGQPLVPRFVHAGDLIGRGIVYGLDHVLPFLDLFAAHNYQGLRSWINVDAPPDDGFWGTKPAKSWNILDHPDEAFKVLEAAAQRGLRWHLASGGYAGTDLRDHEMFETLASLMHDLGPDHVALVEARNEVRDTGGQSPAELEDLIYPVRMEHAQVLCSLSAYTGTEDRSIIQAYTPDWMQLFLIHCYRGGHAWDKIRHRFSDVYDGENGPPVRRLAWRGEPVGVGWPVSATEHMDELDGDTMALIGAMGALRGCWVFMSGPGVILPKTVLEFEQVAGFRETAPLLASLPIDTASFKTLGHSGSSKHGTRIHAVSEDSPDVRADYVISEDGRYVEIVYGPDTQSHTLPQERATTDVQRLHQSRFGHVETGRLA